MCQNNRLLFLSQIFGLPIRLYLFLYLALSGESNLQQTFQSRRRLPSLHYHIPIWELVRSWRYAGYCKVLIGSSKRFRKVKKYLEYPYELLWLKYFEENLKPMHSALHCSARFMGSIPQKVLPKFDTSCHIYFVREFLKYESN